MRLEKEPRTNCSNEEEIRLVRPLVSQSECEPRKFYLLFPQSQYECQAAQCIIQEFKNIYDLCIIDSKVWPTYFLVLNQINGS